jgi:hypothetical protein
MLHLRHVHHLATPLMQAEIFDRVGVPIVDQALKGYNGSIFA